MNEILEMTAEVLVYLPLLDKQRTADQDVERVFHKIHPDKDISEYKKELSAMLQVSNVKPVSMNYRHVQSGLRRGTGHTRGHMCASRHRLHRP